MVRRLLTTCSQQLRAFKYSCRTVERMKNKKKVVLVAGSGALALVLASGAAVAASGDVTTVRPVEVPVVQLTNATPQAPAIFEPTATRVAASDDGSVVIHSGSRSDWVLGPNGLRTGSWVSIKEAGPGPARVTVLGPTAACPGPVPAQNPVQAVSAARNGVTLAFVSSNPLFSCLAGLSAPSNLDSSRARLWVVQKQQDQWRLRLVDEAVTAAVVSGDGADVLYTSTNRPVPSPTGYHNVYSLNLASGVTTRVSEVEQTGARQAYGAFNLRISPDDRYVAWETAESSYTSKMRSDESGNSVSNVLVADRDPDGDGDLRNTPAKLSVVPAPNPSSMALRTGSVVGFTSRSGRTALVYRAQANPGNAKLYVFDMAQKRLFDLGVKVNSYGVPSMSRDGRYFVSGPANDAAPYLFPVFFYDLGATPGESIISATELPMTGTSELDLLSITVTPDRVFLSRSSSYSGGTWTTWEMEVG